jgi:hypothetical protein
MNIFYRDFRADSPVTTGAQWLAALTARVAVALVHALPYGRLTSGQVWVLALVLAAWMGTSVFPGTAGLATIVNAVLVGVGALRLLGRMGEIGRSLAAGLRAAYSAQTEAELAAAGALLGRGLDEYALNALSALVNESTFEAIEKAVLSKFPIPDWFAAAYEQGIFFREFDPKEPVATGGKWFAALSARLALALVDALAYTDVKKQLLASAEQLWLLGLLLAGWVALSVIPATAGVANLVNAILVGIGLVSLLDRAAAVGRALEAGLRAAYEARTQVELDAAGQALAPALSGTVVTLIEVLVTHQAFRAAQAVSLRRFPMPEWFRSRVAKLRAGKGVRGEPPSGPAQSLPPETPPVEPTQSLPPESAPPEAPVSRSPEEIRQRRSPDAGRKSPNETKKARPEPKGPREERPLERAKRLAKGTAVLEGARRTAQVVDEINPVAVGLALGAGVVVVGIGLTAAMWTRSKS